MSEANTPEWLNKCWELAPAIAGKAKKYINDITATSDRLQIENTAYLKIITEIREDRDRLQAEVDSLKKMWEKDVIQYIKIICDKDAELQNLTARCKAVEEERDSLKCCGNCYHYAVTKESGSVCCFERTPIYYRDAVCDNWLTLKKEAGE